MMEQQSGEASIHGQLVYHWGRGNVASAAFFPGYPGLGAGAQLVLVAPQPAATSAGGGYPHRLPAASGASPGQTQTVSHLPLARIFLAALSLGEATPEEFTLALESAAQAELPLLKRFQTLFETVIGVAPLLGLLGTVLGLIEVLSSIRLGEGGMASSTGVTLGVGEALVSTAAGLIVAIVTLLFANLFQGLYRRQRAFLQEAAGKLEILHRRHLRQATRSARPDSWR
jgi:biopolymer transport protein ExbB